MSNWIEHLDELASVETDVKKKVAFQSSARLIKELAKGGAELRAEREALNSAQKVMDVYEKQKRALREELAALKQSLAKVRADAILSVLDTPYDCETPNGDIAWSSGSLQLISSFHLHANKIEDGS